MAFSPLRTSRWNVSSPRQLSLCLRAAQDGDNRLCCGPAPLRTLPWPPAMPVPSGRGWDTGSGVSSVPWSLCLGTYGFLAWGLSSPRNTQPPGIAVPAAGQGRRRWKAAHCACARARCLGAVLVAGADTWVWAAEGRHPSLALPYLPSSAAKGWLWARSAIRQARAGEGHGRGVPPAAPSTWQAGGVTTGPRAICLLLLPQGPWPSHPTVLAAKGVERRQLKVQVNSLHIHGTVPGPRWLILGPGSHSGPGELLL